MATSPKALMALRAGARKNGDLVITVFAAFFLPFFLTLTNSQKTHPHTPMSVFQVWRINAVRRLHLLRVWREWRMCIYYNKGYISKMCVWEIIYCSIS